MAPPPTSGSTTSRPRGRTTASTSRRPGRPSSPSGGYAHSALDVQLGTEGVRQLELDVHLSGGEFVVHHVAGADEDSDCDGDGDETDTLAECLGVLASWSDANPDHHIVVVHVEPKDEDEADFFDPESQKIAGHYQRLDDEIGSVMDAGRDRLVTPDDVRGDKPTLREAITSRGWPKVRDSRGMFIFVMLDRGEHRLRYSGYGGDAASLEDRLMFVEAYEDDADGPLSVITRIDDPEADGDLITERVGQGFLVRTRADTDGREPRGCRSRIDPPFPHTEPCVVGEPDFDRFQAALESGAQLISTDFPHGDRIGNGYFVEIPDGSPSRCNPITAPKQCTAEAIEDL